MAFQPAQKRNAKLRLAISGTAGAGKTYSAILMAKELGGRIALMDSERGSAEKYADLTAFDHCNVEERTVQEYIRLIGEAAAGGYDVLVIDSYSHSWIGALETVDKMGGSKFSNGWKVVSPLVSKLVDAILSYPGHVIATMRSKAEYVVEKDAQGRAVPRKVGLATVARDGTDYEFDVMIDLTPEGGLAVTKTRCSALTGEPFTREDVPRIVRILKGWIGQGAPLAPIDVFRDRIRFAADTAALTALVPEIAKLDAATKAALRPTYEARKRTLAEGEEAA